MDWAILWEYRAALLGGLAITLAVSALAIVGATLVGVLVGCARASQSYLLQRLTASYTELLRNLPLIVKLFFLYFVVGLPGLPAALAALILHQSAYIADVTASGLRSVGRGQLDAGLSLGLKRWLVYRRIILPQTVRVMLPPMTSQYVSVVKNTSVVALIGIADLTFETQQINVETFRGFEAATAATLLYMLIAGGVIACMTLWQRRQVVQMKAESRTQIWLWRALVLIALAVAAWRVVILDWSHVTPSWQFLLLALGRSWWLALIAMAIGIAAAVPLALLRVYGPRWPRRGATLLIEAVRATPELMIIFWVYFTLPMVTGSQVTAWNAALGSLSVIAAAYLAEVVRAGLYSVPATQREAARALGLKPLAVFRLVVVPQALRNMLPALIAQLVSLFKTTSLVYAIGVMDFFRAVSVTNNAVYAPYPLYVVLATGYFVSCWTITQVVRHFDPAYQLAD